MPKVKLDTHFCSLPDVSPHGLKSPYILHFFFLCCFSGQICDTLQCNGFSQYQVYMLFLMHTYLRAKTRCFSLCVSFILRHGVLEIILNSEQLFFYWSSSYFSFVKRGCHPLELPASFFLLFCYSSFLIVWSSSNML